MAINDQLSVLSGKDVDVILETAGGLAEVAEDIVKLLRTKFDRVGFIIPGQAKSAGIIMAMSGDDILMEPVSSLGPIDAQITWQGKSFSAHAFLKGFEKIKEEVDKTNKLNRAYIPMLQTISPGELQACENAQSFSKSPVSKWLQRYRFSRWETHSDTGQPVTVEEKKARAEEIAAKLCDHSRWLTHGRSIKIDHLRDTRLIIIDYSEHKDLCEAIRRYHLLLRMTFDTTNIYKLFETPSSQIARHIVVGQSQRVSPTGRGVADVEIECKQCRQKTKIQANLGNKRPKNPALNHFRRTINSSAPPAERNSLLRSYEGE